jgi:lipopolysaccharide export system ATP-binding protein
VTVAAQPLSAPPAGPVKKRIEVHDLVKIFRGRRVVDGVSLAMDQGEIVGLLGPNGAGKTTVFNMIVGLVHPTSGSVFLDGEDIARYPMYQRARRGIGYLAQEASVFRKLSARENVILVLEMVGYRGDRRKRAEELLDELHIGRIADTRGYALSGGERRRVEIARALAANPAFLLLDEPFAGVDPLATEDIQSVVRALCDKGIGILITDHDARATLRLTERAYILADGKVVTQGTSREIANDPLARKYYLGEHFQL